MVATRNIPVDKATTKLLPSCNCLQESGISYTNTAIAQHWLRSRKLRRDYLRLVYRKRIVFSSWSERFWRSCGRAASAEGTSSCTMPNDIRRIMRDNSAVSCELLPLSASDFLTFLLKSAQWLPVLGWQRLGIFQTRIRLANRISGSRVGWEEWVIQSRQIPAWAFSFCSGSRWGSQPCLFPLTKVGERREHGRENSRRLSHLRDKNVLQNDGDS
jgi:hypothetical protein